MPLLYSGKSIDKMTEEEMREALKKIERDEDRMWDSRVAIAEAKARGFHDGAMAVKG